MRKPETSPKAWLAMAFLSLTGLTLGACGDSSFEPVTINIPTEEDDECCSQTEELATNYFLADLKEVEGVSGQTVGLYTVRVFAADATLHTGYNDLYFAVEKTESGRHVKNIAFTALSPLMTMGSDMQHSTPVGSAFSQVQELPVYHTWVAFLMASDADKGQTWALPFSYRIEETVGTFAQGSPVVKALPEGQTWIKSFKWNEQTYYLTLANAPSLATGVNTLKAYVSRQNADRTLPYTEAPETFTIDLVPTMPDMGDHTSPGNEPLTRQPDGSYAGTLNLTMTGTWDLHLTVRSADGQVVAGGTDSDDELSPLYWTVTL